MTLSPDDGWRAAARRGGGPVAARLWGTSTPARAARIAAVGLVGAAIVLATGVLGSSPTSGTGAQPSSFTFMVLPDTQGYTRSESDAFIMGQQTRWIRDYRTDLNTAFVAQVGDLVESHPSDPMWQRASQAMKVLDDAGVPSSVLPGNHDMDVETGEAAKYDEYFPASRYDDATWTPSTARYGGHLGENLYGADPVDRGNKDSFSLFSAGGMDFLVLSLEYEAPDDALSWAQKVIDAHPDRRVIVATHDFIDTDDQRGDFNTRKDAGINAAPQIWDRLIFPNCNVFMVVNGHWTSRTDPAQGEGRRTDVNACGKPVHQLLSNYQGRPHGGDGWLRYYTFDPANDTISARTYSPYLQRFETDDDSQFTLDYPMSTPSDDLVTVLSGPASDWRYRFADTDPPVDWAAADFDDSSWKQGSASLGFGAYGPATSLDVPRGGSRPLAAQFRRTLSISGAGKLARPALTVVADDGVVVYVNGREIGRTNLPKGTPTGSTYAVAARSHDDAAGTPVTFDIPAGVLTEGTNVIAAQVSSNYRSTGDMTFEAVLTSSRS